METTQRRSVGLMILLVLIAMRDLIGAVLTVQNAGNLRQAMPEWAVWAIAACSAFSAASAVALLTWRQWGFYGVCLSYLGLIALNIRFGVEVFDVAYFVVMRAFTVAVLFGFLVKGGENSAWAGMK